METEILTHINFKQDEINKLTYIEIEKIVNKFGVDNMGFKGKEGVPDIDNKKEFNKL